MDKLLKLVWDNKKDLGAVAMYVGEKIIMDQLNRVEIRMAVKEELKKTK